LEDARLGATAIGLGEWNLASSEIVADYKIFRARRDICRSPRTGDDLPFVVLEGPDWVQVVAITAEQRWILVRQFRMGSRQLSLEIPGGMVDPGEDPLHAAQRELLEETGFTSSRWRELGWVYPNPAFQINRCFTYLAEECVQVSAIAQDEGEDLELVELSTTEVLAAAREGRITHALVIAAIFFWLANKSVG
jgi:8-oxo-dGTP pyrophosphatase MutT (NUDIX family)